MEQRDSQAQAAQAGQGAPPAHALQPAPAAGTEVPFATIEEALEELRAGRMVVVVDDEDRENEGDLVMAAEKATPEAINFMTRHGRGLVCVPLTAERLDQLRIPLMPGASEQSMRTAFAVSVDVVGVSTGISAYERAATVRALADPARGPADFIRPGHVFPLRAKPGGVLQRAGHTEAAVDLARLAGLFPAGVVCEIMNEDGTMARLPQLVEFARRFGLRIISVADLIRYRLRTENLVRVVAEASLPTPHGSFRMLGFESLADGEGHVALVRGEVRNRPGVLVRLHSQCLTGDVFGSLRCDCGDQLRAALQALEAEPAGVLIYLRQEGRGIGLLNKLRAYSLQDQGKDTVEANEALGFAADLRHYGVAAQILKELGVRQIRLLTNNPAKVRELEGFGIQVLERVPLRAAPRPENLHYLLTKQHKLGHLLDLPADGLLGSFPANGSLRGGEVSREAGR
ncbi:MAG TPA: bifunctional 3,4-dihydroxy-2-butanone-4-phosphate synthase/GTP cyclohydrolase II [Limnochordales bacterium]